MNPGKGHDFDAPNGAHGASGADDDYPNADLNIPIQATPTEDEDGYNSATARLSSSLLVLLTLAAFGLRIFQLDVQSLWYDEGVTAEMARRSFADLTRWTAQDIQPPLYYYVVAAWGRLAGWSEWSLRFPSAFFGALLVPLMAALAAAVTRRRSAAIAAALFTAAHPLLLYYSQEARMYAMLTLLTVALAYYVLSRRGRRLSTGAYWTGYVVLAAAAVYTHYFAFFFLAALGVVFICDLLFFRSASGRSPGDSRLLENKSRRFGYFCLAQVALLLVYAPWLTAMFSQLSTDASYWEGEFKLDEALRHIANRFTSGETMIEAQATQWLVAFGVLTLLAVIVLAFSGMHSRRTLLIGLFWLLLPVGGILGLAQLVPKFNARYAMIALPGLLLLWSAGLAQLFVWRPRRVRAMQRPGTHDVGVPTEPIRLQPHRRAGRRAQAVGVFRAGLAGVATLFLLAVFALSNYNWFADAAYTKAEWRQLSQFVRHRMAADGSRDLVVLVSGHAWPVWNYYAPDMPPLRLPELEILDVNEVLDFATTARPLRAALQEMDDVWLVEWQDDIVDPMKIVPLQLQLAGEERQVRNQFWHLNISHFTSIHADAVLIEPTGISERSVNFANQVYLLDYTVAENGDLLLFWQLHPDLAAEAGDLRVTAELYTEQGLPYFRMIDRRPAGFDYPVFRWRQEQITLGRIPAQEWAGPGAVPGAYRMRVGVYDVDGDLSGLDILGASGQPLGKHTNLDLVLPVTTAGPRPVDRVAFAEMLPDIWLEVGVDMEQAEPGQAIGAELHWFLTAPTALDFDLQLIWRSRDDNDVRGQQRIAVSSPGKDDWPVEQLLRSLHLWRAPLNLPPDDYWLEVGLGSVSESVENTVRLPMRITGSTRRYTPPAYATSVDRVFNAELHLLGVIEPLDFEPRAGGQVALSLVWQASELIPDDYTVTVQWLGADNRPVTQADLSLPGGSSNWLAGQVELQSVIVNVPENPGTYRLIAAVYNPNAPDLPRLLTDAGEDLIELATFTVVE